MTRNMVVLCAMLSGCGAIEMSQDDVILPSPVANGAAPVMPERTNVLVPSTTSLPADADPALLADAPPASSSGCVATEACDGVDNDCDGQTDESPAWAVAFCDGQRWGGVCDEYPRVVTCEWNRWGGGTWQMWCDFVPTDDRFEPPGSGLTEEHEGRCDHLDNDCDGQTDEGFRTGGCYVGDGVCRRFGTMACQPDGTNACGDANGVPLASDMPSEETCGDGTDDDCDGEADEGCPVPECLDHKDCRIGGECWCDGGGQFLCEVITGMCVDGACERIVSSEDCANGCSAGGCRVVETCDRADNDGDGMTDEGVLCPDGQACLAYGACACVDAEGQIDFREGCPCSGVTGVCSENGTVELRPDGSPVCSTDVGGSDDRSSAETVNGLDDDCDGMTDEVCGGADTDSDGVGDGCDNCVFVANPRQEDLNRNGTGEACERAPEQFVLTFDVPEEQSLDEVQFCATFNNASGSWACGVITPSDASSLRFAVTQPFFDHGNRNNRFNVCTTNGCTREVPGSSPAWLLQRNGDVLYPYLAIRDATVNGLPAGADIGEYGRSGAAYYFFPHWPALPHVFWNANTPSGSQVASVEREIARLDILNPSDDPEDFVLQPMIELVHLSIELSGAIRIADYDRTIHVYNRDRSVRYGTLVFPAGVETTGGPFTLHVPLEFCRVSVGEDRMLIVTWDTRDLGGRVEPDVLSVRVPSGGLEWRSVVGPYPNHTHAEGLPLPPRTLTFY